MTNIYYEAEFPGPTAGEALSDARAALRDLPFVETESSITLRRVYDSEMWASSEDDESLRDEMREGNWSWVATVKARGRANL